VADFYPPTLDSKDYLAYYSQVFDLAQVRISSSNKYALANWTKETPDNFRFLVQVPRQATDIELIGKFLEDLAAIEEKILAVIIQVPAMTLIEGRDWLDKILGKCVYHGFSAALEFGHGSWFQDMTYNILRKHGAALVWSDRHHNPVVTSDFLCLRLAGNNQRAWIEKVKEQAHLEFSAIIVDSPAQANETLGLLDMQKRKYAGRSPALSLPYMEPWKGRVVMCVDLNAFYPSCEELREPVLRGKPHAVIMTDQKDKVTKGVVSSCSYKARKFGIRSAMPLARALALCPDLVLRPVDMPYYKQISEKVIDVLARYADVLEQASIDEAFLDCTSRAGNDPYGYAAKIKKAIMEECGLLSSVGVAPSKSTAKIASDFQKPDGLTVVHPDHVQKFLAPLEVGRISGVGPKTQQTLDKIGIKTIGQLAGFDVQKLTERFGRNGLWMWKVANGSEDEAVLPREDSISLSTEHTLEEFTRDKDRIAIYLDELVSEVYNRLVRRGYMFRTVGVKIVRSDFTIETRETSFSELQTRSESISSVIGHLLGKFEFGDSTHAVRKVGLRVTNLVSVQEEEFQTKPQKTLFDYL